MAVKIVCVVLLLELLCTTSMVICQVQGDSDYSREAAIRIKFLLEPNDLIVRKGKSAILHCVARSIISTETVGISWTFNGEHLDLEQESRRYIHRNGSLIFTKVVSKKQNGLSSDEGTYRCVARSLNVALASKPAQLKVAYFSKNISIYPTDEDSVVVGQTVRIACNLDSVPPAEISWSFQNRTLSSLEPNSRYNMIIPGVLYISDVQDIDSGEYRCIGKNKIVGKSRTSGPCKLIVTSKNDSASTSLRKLEYLSPLLPKVVTVRQNHDLILDCAVRGFTNRVNLFWIYSASENEDKTILKNNTRGFSTYKKSNVKVTDSGIYTCIASLVTVSKGNPIISNQEIRVNVITPPIIVKGPKNWNLPVALNVRFECEAIGNPTPHISWLHNGIPLKADGRIKQSETELILKNTVSDDSGIYQCVATNDFGSAYAASQLSIMGSSYQPSPPVNVHCITINSTQILVSWQLPPDDSLEQPPILIKAQDLDAADSYEGYRDHVSIQKAYSVHYYLTDDDSETESQELSVNRSIVLNRLQPHKNYTIYIRTYNGKSGSDQSQHVTCQTSDPEQTIQITLKVVGPTMVFLRWLVRSKNHVEEDNLIYRVQWRKSFSAEFNLNEMETNITSFTLFGLHSSTEYELRVIAVSKTGCNIVAESEWLSVMTHPDSSIFVPVLKLDILNSTSVQVIWKIDETFEIDALKLSYRKQHENSDKPAAFVNLNADQKKYIISDLEPSASYNISLEVTVDMTTNGVASEIIQMPPEFNEELQSSRYLPAPTNVQAESRSPNTIHVTWTPPKHVSVNFYTIYCVSLEDATSNNKSRIVTSFNNTALITDLYSNILYEVKVVACRNDTYSGYSEKVQVRTSNYVSGIIESISWAVLNSSSVRVSWQHSLNPSSISSFIVRYTRQRNAPFQVWKSLFTGNATTIDITSLNENTNYYVMVQAKLNSGDFSSPNITSVFISSHRPLQSSTASLATSKYNITDEQWLGIYIGIAIGLSCIVLCIGFVYICRKRYNKQKEEFEEQRKRRFSPNNHEISKMSSCYNKAPYAVNGYVNNNATVQIPLLPSSSEGTSNGIAPNVHLTETSRHFELSKGVSLQEETNTLLSSDSIAEDDSPTTLNGTVPDKDDKEAGDSGYCDRRSSQSPQLNDSNKTKSRKSSEITIDDGFYENDMHTMVQVHG